MSEKKNPPMEVAAPRDAAVERAMDKLFKPAAGVGTLREFMNALTKDDLLEIAKAHGLKGCRTLKKADLVEQLCPMVISRIEWIRFLNRRNLKLLRKAVEGSPCPHEHSPWNFMIYLFERNLVFPIILDGERVWAVPTDLIKPLLKTMDSVSEALREANDQTVRLAEGLAEAYGVLSLLEMMDFMKGYMGEEIDIDEVLTTLKENELAGVQYRLDIDGLYHDAVEDPEILATEIAKRPNIAYKVFAKEEILAMADREQIFDMPEFKTCAAYVAKTGKLELDIAEDIVTDTLMRMQEEGPAGEPVKDLIESIGFDSIDQINELLKVLMSAYNSAPQWELKGHAPKGVFSEDRQALRPLPSTPFVPSGGISETVVREGAKVGRNDPCPCGSGKKFKKCCGAN